MKKKSKKAIPPAVAVVGFLVSLAVAAKFILGSDIAKVVGGGSDASANDMPEDPVAGTPVAAETIQWHDLLEVYGSFDTSEPVRLAFSVPLDASLVAAAPSVETQMPGKPLWQGEDPPAVQLGVVMISAAARRAVFGGKVVGVGDPVANGRVLAIESGLLMLQWGGRKLTYDLDGQSPREFRAEEQRRASLTKGTVKTANDGKSGEKQEKSQ